MKLNSNDKFYLEKLIKNFSFKKKKFIKYPLLEDAFDHEDILSGIEVLLSKQLTMSENTYNFEKQFSNFIGTKYALMVNSGSSANLLAAFATINPLNSNVIKRDSCFLIPSLCWSTSLWPLVQAGLKPIFIDVNKKSFCLDDERITKNILRKIKIIMTIHILGNSNNIEKLKYICRKNNIVLIEDTCEALGSKYKSKYLGSFGDFGTFSFYYSHQITSGEGGMIVCNDKKNYEILCSLRSHGWDRHNKTTKKQYFNFINSGFNLRPTDITAAIGYSQFKRLNKMIKIRTSNRNLIIDKLKKSHNWNDQYIFFEPSSNVKPSYFGFPLLINPKYISLKKKIIRNLNLNGIETRPILSGNFLNQPSARLYNFKLKKKDFKISQEIEDQGFFIGLPTKNITTKNLDHLVKNLLCFG